MNDWIERAAERIAQEAIVNACREHPFTQAEFAVMVQGIIAADTTGWSDRPKVPGLYRWERPAFGFKGLADVTQDEIDRDMPSWIGVFWYGPIPERETP